jgi:hypothetical protein
VPITGLEDGDDSIRDKERQHLLELGVCIFAAELAIWVHPCGDLEQRVISTIRVVSPCWSDAFKYALSIEADAGSCDISSI